MMSLYHNYLVRWSTIHRKFLCHWSSIFFGVWLRYHPTNDSGLVYRRLHIVLLEWYLKLAGSRHLFVIVKLFVFLLWDQNYLVCQELAVKLSISRVLLTSMETQFAYGLICSVKVFSWSTKSACMQISATLLIVTLEYFKRHFLRDSFSYRTAQISKFLVRRFFLAFLYYLYVYKLLDQIFNS